MRGFKAWAKPASRKESPMWRTTVLGGMGGGSGGAGAGADGDAVAGGVAAALSAGLAVAVPVELGGGGVGCSLCPTLEALLAVPALGRAGGGSLAVAGPHAGRARARVTAAAIEGRGRGSMGRRGRGAL
jgi:hypothetical protein